MEKKLIVQRVLMVVSKKKHQHAFITIINDNKY